jgi:hypothetical protein
MFDFIFYRYLNGKYINIKQFDLYLELLTARLLNSFSIRINNPKINNWTKGERID